MLFILLVLLTRAAAECGRELAQSGCSCSNFFGEPYPLKFQVLQKTFGKEYRTVFGPRGISGVDFELAKIQGS